jgi:hypothetical protein
MGPSGNGLSGNVPKWECSVYLWWSPVVAWILVGGYSTLDCILYSSVPPAAPGRAARRTPHTAHCTLTRSLTHSHKWAHRRAGRVSQPRRISRRGSSSDPPPAARRDNPAPAIAQRCATAATARCHVPRARRPVTRWQPRAARPAERAVGRVGRGRCTDRRACPARGGRCGRCGGGVP